MQNGALWVIMGHFGSLWPIMGHLIMGHFGSFCVLVQPFSKQY